MTGEYFDQRLALETDASIQLLAALIDALQHMGRRQPFEGAAHGKALVETLTLPLAIGGVEHGDAHASCGLLFDARPWLGCVLTLRCGAGGERQCGSGGAGAQRVKMELATVHGVRLSWVKNECGDDNGRKHARGVARS